MTTIGWLGTGRMGSAMVGRLLAAGRHVTVWNRTRSKATALGRLGATVGRRPSDLARCDVVVTMVGTPDDLDDVVLGPTGLLSGDGVPGVLVDCTTTSVGQSAAMRAELQRYDVPFVAAPVSGNPNVVTAGAACIVGSGPPDAWSTVEPVLRDIAGTLVYAGGGEQSRLVKLCHNLFLGMLVQGLVEVLTVAEKGGTERSAFLEFLGGTVLSSPWIVNRSDAIVARDWTPTFTLELLRKDFDLGVAAARDLEVPIPVAASVHQLIQAAVGAGWADADLLALYEQQARNAALIRTGDE